MGVDFSGFIKVYLYKFNNELKESIKDKSISEKETIFLERITSLFLSKYILIIISEKNLNPYYYFVNISMNFNQNSLIKIYFPFLDNLITNNFAENILNNNDDIKTIMESLTNEIKEINNQNLEPEKLEKDLYTNNNSNLIEFYSAILKSGIDFLTKKENEYQNIIDGIIKSSELLNIEEKKMILKEIIEIQSLKKSNYIQQILVLILLQIKGNNQYTLNELIEKNQVNCLIKIIERIKSKENELQTDFSNFITNSKINMNIEDLKKIFAYSSFFIINIKKIFS